MEGSEIHTECLMKEEWARLHEMMKSMELRRNADLEEVSNKFSSFLVSQTTVNNEHLASITKLMHKIYGNTNEGLSSTVQLNRQTAASDIVNVRASVTRIWWVFGVIITLLIANLGFVITMLVRIKP